MVHRGEDSSILGGEEGGHNKTFAKHNDKEQVTCEKGPSASTFEKSPVFHPDPSRNQWQKGDMESPRPHQF